MPGAPSFIMSSISLVLSAGGARGAYQVGVLKALKELSSGKRIPFDVLCGVSSGSINTAALASHADNFEHAIDTLEAVWTNVTSSNVFRTDIRTVSSIGMKWLKDLSLGGITGGGSPKSLLDTDPLQKLLAKHIPIHRIKQNVDAGYLRALTVTATNYYTSNAVTFVQAKKDVPMWRRTRRMGEHADIGLEHLMASSSIPIFFPSVQIDGRHFGDGCIRNTWPLSPAIYLGAKKILAVGVRKRTYVTESKDKKPTPSVAHIAGVILNAVLLDSIEIDIVRMDKINHVVKRLQDQSKKYRHIEHLWISPSEDIGELALSYYKKLPRVIRYLLKGLGPDKQVTDIVSFLLFDPTYCKKLIELGYKDTKERSGQIIQFLKTV